MSFAFILFFFSVKKNLVRSAIEIDFDWKKKGGLDYFNWLLLEVEIYQQRMTSLVFDLTLRDF